MFVIKFVCYDIDDMWIDHIGPTLEEVTSLSDQAYVFDSKEKAREFGDNHFDKYDTWVVAKA